MYNKLTKKTISVGSNCYTKFGFKNNGVIKNLIFYNVIKNILKQGVKHKKLCFLCKDINKNKINNFIFI
jgi:hypothetical protein